MLYFAYGSNLCAAQMAARCPDSRFVGVARLAGWRVVFDLYSRKRGGTVADLAPDGASDVWGALYELSTADLARLDRCEGVPRQYRRIALGVENAAGETVAAWVYVGAAHAAEPDPAGVGAGSPCPPAPPGTRQHGQGDPAPTRGFGDGAAVAPPRPTHGGNGTNEQGDGRDGGQVRPTRAYLDAILRGARERGLPADYIQKLSEQPCASDGTDGGKG